jgi:hypothetical protein
MAFVNEFVSPEDFERYGFKEINRKLRMMDEETCWTVDKKRDIYLRWISQVPPPVDPFWHFHMYWHGKLFKVFIKYSGPNLNHLRSLVGIELPEELEPHREEIIEDLKAALKIFGEFGSFSINKNINVTFDF